MAPEQGVQSIPRLGLGTAGVSPDRVGTIVYEALKAGYRHIDCAVYYKNQKEIGDGLQKAFQEGIVQRKDVWITSKVWNDSHDEKGVWRSCEITLRDLGVDYIDLMLVHWPLAVKKDDPNQLAYISLARTWAVMESLVHRGKAKHIGVSNFDIQLLLDLLSYCRLRPYTNQVECHVYLNQQHLLDYLVSEKIYLTAYCPIGNPSLPAAGPDVPVALKDSSVLEIAKKHGRTPAQVLLRWQLQRTPWTVVIPKTAHVERLRENANVWDFELSEDEMRVLGALNRNARLIRTPGSMNVFTF